MVTYVKFSKITYFFIWLCHKTCGTLVPQKGIGPGPPGQWKHWLPTIGLPGNAQILNFFELKFLHLQNSIIYIIEDFLEIIIGNICHTPHSLWPFSFFSFFLLFYFILFFNFTILYWFCHTSTWIRHRYTRVPHPEPSSLPVPPLWVIPMHQLQASSFVHRTWTGDSFHIWYYTWFNAILPNHPTVSLSHRVQKTVLYISVSFTVSYTGLSLPSF